jgi:flagellar biosynthetic protein FliR
METGLPGLGFVLPTLRVLSVASAFPFLAGPGTPRLARLGAALALALVLVGPAVSAAVPPLPPAGLLLAAPNEILVGLAIGAAFSFVFSALFVAGEFLGQEMGLNAASQIDPVTGRNVPILARLFEALGVVLFVEIGGLAALLRTVRASFDGIPPGSFVPPTRLAGALVEAATASIGVGIRIAVPVVFVLLLVTLFSTVALRALPRVHLFDFAYSIRILVALLGLVVLLPRLVPAIDGFTAAVMERLAGAR